MTTEAKKTQEREWKNYRVSKERFPFNKKSEIPVGM